MRQLKIKEIGEVVSGSTPKTDKKEYWDGEIPWVTPKELGQLEGKYLNNTERKITTSGFKSCSTRLIPPGNILFTSRAPIGHLAINKIEVCTNQGFKSIILKEDFSADYIYFALKKNVAKLQDLGTGSTFKELSKAKFEEFVLSVPPLPAQRHIAQLLSQAEQLIAQRQESLRLLDAYLKSTFLEMFGDPVRNEKGWDVKQLMLLVDKLGDGLHGTPEYDEDGEYYFVNGNNLDKGYIRMDEKTKKVSYAEYIKHSKELNENTILVSINGTLGRVAFYRGEKIILGKSACYFNLKKGAIAPLFLFHFLESEFFLRYVTSKATGSTISNVSLRTMRELPIIIPPMSLQTQFAQIVAQTEILKTQYKQSLAELEQLYGSLSQKAFRGELTYALEMSGK